MAPAPPKGADASMPTYIGFLGPDDYGLHWVSRRKLSVTALVTPNDGVAPDDGVEGVAPDDGVAPHDRVRVPPTIVSRLLPQTIVWASVLPQTIVFALPHTIVL